MDTKELLDRINHLANKSKSTGLTEEEKEEQQKLRKQYLGGFRESFTNQLTSVKVIDPEGNDVTPDKVKQLKREQEK